MILAVLSLSQLFRLHKHIWIRSIMTPPFQLVNLLEKLCIFSLPSTSSIPGYTGKKKHSGIFIASFLPLENYLSLSISFFPQLPVSFPLQVTLSTWLISALFSACFSYLISTVSIHQNQTLCNTSAILSIFSISLFPNFHFPPCTCHSLLLMRYFGKLYSSKWRCFFFNFPLFYLFLLFTLIIITVIYFCAPITNSKIWFH